MHEAGLHRIVIDTNVYVSRLLGPASIPARAVIRAESIGEILATEATRLELYEVLHRPRLARYISPELCTAFLDHFERTTIMVSVPTPIRACRDPRDDKFLEAAVHGNAALVLTGDTDLLALHPYQGVAILTPGEYLERNP